MILRSKRKLPPPDNQVEKHDEHKVESKHEQEADKADTKKVKPWKWRKALEPDPLIAHSIHSKGPQLAVSFPLENLNISHQGIFRSPPEDLNTGSARLPQEHLNTCPNSMIRFGQEKIMHCWMTYPN